MPCNCSCTCCDKLLLTTSLVLTENLELSIPGDVSLINLENYCLVINRCFPVGTTTQKVVLKTPTKTYPLLCKLGNNIHADQIEPRHKYHVVFGADPIHFTITDCVPRTSYVGATASTSDSSSDEVITPAN